MKASSIYRKVAKTAALAALAAFAAVALLATTTAQARPHYFQDVQYVQPSVQLVVSQPQFVVQAPLGPVFVQPVHQRPVYVAPVYQRPVYARPVVVQHQPVYYTTQWVPGVIYYVDGRPFLNGHPYYGKGHKRHHVKHYDKHFDKHFDKHHGGHR